MKKVFLSLLAFVAITIVACDKDFDDADTIAVDVEDIGATVENEKYSIDDALSLLNSVSKSVEMDVAETSKVGPTGSNFLHIVLFTHESAPLAALSSEQGTELCFGNLDGFHASILYVLDETNSRLNIEIENADSSITTQTVNLSANLLTRYQGPLFFGGSLDQLIVNTNAARDGTASGSVPSIGLFNFGCTAASVSSFYTITPAPFPLNGFLATMVDNYATMTGWPGGTSANYAATTTPTLIQAIEADIRNGQ